ncbi:hypothetical protein ACFVVU_37425 [Kitasatospora sp. NPDC057965]|uniref:hypothetical protein n=1 Tax=Kitasatospora sp. NPDC057965 TaxID=3346291 RepID=UPI0036D91E5C
MSDEADVSYSATTDFRWTERAFALLGSQELTVTPHEAGGARCFVVAGRCPRCDHHLVDRQVTAALTGLSGASRGEGAEAVAVVSLDVTCSCGSAHQDAPQGATGCGVSFRIEVEAASE